MFLAILSLLESALSIWASKEKTKYIDRKIELKRAWDEEFNKDPDERSDAVLDNLFRELCILADSVASGIRESNLKT